MSDAAETAKIKQISGRYLEAEEFYFGYFRQTKTLNEKDGQLQRK